MGPRSSNRSPTTHDVVQVGETSPSSHRSTVRSSRPSGRRRRDRVAALGLVAVLAPSAGRRRAGRGGGRASRHVERTLRARFVADRATVATCRSALILAAAVGALAQHASAVRPRGMSVALIALLLPLVAAVVVAERLPEPGLVLSTQLEAADPLGALPEVEVGHDEPGRAAVLRRERLAVVLVGDECLAVEDVGQGQVGRVAAVGVGDRERGPGSSSTARAACRRSPLPLHVELRPLRDAPDVDHEIARGQRRNSCPRPSDRGADEALELE